MISVPDPIAIVRRLGLLAASIALGLLALVLLAPSAATAQAPELPLSFTPNEGQTDERVRYLSQGTGYSFFFTDDKAVLSFTKSEGATSQGLALDMRFVGANPDAKLEAGDRAPGTVNRLTADEGSKTGIPTYEELTYRELWPGIDMVFKGQDGALKYEFHVDPGADPRDIRLAYAGADGLSVGSHGELEIDTALGELTDARPASYQRIGGEDVPVASRYALQDDGYGFAVAPDYDHSRPLVIDPGLAYSTFVGGSGSDSGRGIAVDDDGNTYVTGQTASADYPTTPGVYDPSYNNNTDAFVTKLNRSGSAIVYSTFIGGTAFDSGNGIAVDDDGSAYIAGFTGSVNYPTTPGSFDPTHNGGSDAFVSKLNPSGSALEYSTYLGSGGFGFDGANGIAVDGDGSAYVTGFAGGASFPTTAGAFDTTHNGRNDVYVTKLVPAGSALAYSTFIGGSLLDTGNKVAVDEEGRAHVTGLTQSADFPTTPGAADPTHNGGNDVFVTTVDASGSAVDMSTFLGGAANEAGNGITVDDTGRTLHVAGATSSADYPTTRKAYDPSYNGGGDAFVTKLDASDSELEYSTFLGGAGTDSANGLAVDDKGGNAHITGSTSSADYPTTRKAYDPSYNGGGDAFVTELKQNGKDLASSTFLGGIGVDIGHAIALDEKGKVVHLTGSTSSGDFPTTRRALDGSHSGGDDAYVVMLDDDKGHGGDGHR